MNKYKKYRELTMIAKKANEKIDQAVDNVNCTMFPDDDSYWNSPSGKAECAMHVHAFILQAYDSLKELDAEWSKVVKKLYKEYEDTPWD